MFKYIFLFFISLTCVASETKFHFMDCVKVVNGFYKNCKGNIVNYVPGDKYYKTSYTVDGDCKGQGFMENFYEDQLQLMEIVKVKDLWKIFYEDQLERCSK